MKTQVRKMVFSVALAVTVMGGLAVFAQSANAQCWGGGWGGGLQYHHGSMHYHRSYHPTMQHWTPGLGLHIHGHFDYTPHYIPGQFHYSHGHMHWNR